METECDSEQLRKWRGQEMKGKRKKKAEGTVV
jgi:hypothetical protein